MLSNVFSSGEAQRITGVSEHQLAYWAKTGLIRPSIQAGTGRGSRRLYSRLDLVQLRVTKKLLDAKFSLQAIRKSARLLQHLLTLDALLPELVVVLDGKQILVCRQSDLDLKLVERERLDYLRISETLGEIDGGLAAAAPPPITVGGHNGYAHQDVVREGHPVPR